MNISNITSATTPSIPLMRTKRDIVGKAHFRPMRDSAVGASRFRDFQQALLKGLNLSPPANTAACLVAFDGIVTTVSLVAALTKIDDIYTWHDETCLEWHDEIGRVDRRFLSVFTSRAWAVPSHAHHPSVTLIIDELNAALCDFYPASLCCPLEQLLHDAQAWLLESLPGPLFAHCISAAPLAAIPRSAFAREQRGMALRETTEPPTLSEGSRGFALALDGYFSPLGKDQGSWLIASLVVACRRKDSIADDLDKQRMLKECLALASKGRDAGSVSSVILAWAIDLVESGTFQESNISPRTIHLYVSAIAMPLFHSLKSFDFEQSESEHFAAMYESIINSVTQGTKRTAASALSSFHHFLELWFDVPSIRKSLHKELAQSPPKANLIWTHEIDLIGKWIISATCDRRLRDQIDVCFAIARTVRVRASELLKLRIRNVRIYPNNVLEVEICPMRRDGKLKSDSSRRVSAIHDQNTVSLIFDWVRRRRLEGALHEDLLFGDPHHPSSGYKLGQLYATLNQLLKCATGDSSVSLHTLSHTHISYRIREAILSDSVADVNPIDLVSAEAGHASSQTSLTHYFHLFERLLRHYLDKAIRLTSRTVADYSCVSADAFRHRCARNNGVSRQSIALQIINASRPILLVDAVDAPFVFASAIAPTNILGQRVTSFTDVLNVLCDLTDARSISETCARNNIDETALLQISSCACSSLEQMVLLERSIHVRSVTSAVSDFQLTINCSGSRAIQFVRIYHPKLAPLLQHLSDSSHASVYEIGIRSWLYCFDKGYVSLEKPAIAAGLVHLLNGALMPINQLTVCIQHDASTAHVPDQMAVSQIVAMFRTAYPDPPHFDTKSVRRGRPKAYLMISSCDPNDRGTLQSAASSIVGLNALLFAGHVFQQLQCLNNSNPREGCNHE